MGIITIEIHSGTLQSMLDSLLIDNIFKIVVTSQAFDRITSEFKDFVGNVIVQALSGDLILRLLRVACG